MPLNNYPTYEMLTVGDHERLLAEPRAVLLLWFEWSGPAQTARRAIGHWHERWHLYCKTPVAPLYLLDGDQIPELFTWLRETVRDVNGYGSIHLLIEGTIVATFRSVIDSGLFAISQECDRHFGGA